MKKFFVIIMLLAILLCGCEKMDAAHEEPENSRFDIEYIQPFRSFGQIYIIRDTETGKAYLFAKNGYSGGIIALEEN